MHVVVAVANHPEYGLSVVASRGSSSPPRRQSRMISIHAPGRQLDRRTLWIALLFAYAILRVFVATGYVPVPALLPNPTDSTSDAVPSKGFDMEILPLPTSRQRRRVQSLAELCDRAHIRK